MSNLILIPTSAEQHVLQPLLQPIVADGHWQIELTGFGPIAAAARSASLIAQHQPERVCLVGIAGTYSPRVPVGHASVFSQVSSDGIGAGSGNAHVSATDMGWPMIENPQIGETIELSDTSPDKLVTVCAASANEEEVQRRRTIFAGAVAEDMEGFGVALSCKLAGVELSIVRGMSNVAGQRDPNSWQIDLALHAAADLTLKLLQGDWQ